MVNILSIDLGVAFTYTGCGGRDLKGTKQKPKNLRTAPQTTNQTFDWPMNAALRVSRLLMPANGLPPKLIGAL